MSVLYQRYWILFVSLCWWLSYLSIMSLLSYMSATLLGATVRLGYMTVVLPAFLLSFLISHVSIYYFATDHHSKVVLSFEWCCCFLIRGASYWAVPCYSFSYCQVLFSIIVASHGALGLGTGLCTSRAVPLCVALCLFSLMFAAMGWPRLVIVALPGRFFFYFYYAYRSTKIALLDGFCFDFTKDCARNRSD